MFDFNNVEEQGGFEPLPAGTYPVYVDSVDWKVSQAGAEYLKLAFKVFEGEKEGRLIFNNYNLMHPKEQVKNIAMSQIKTLLVNAGFKLDGLKLTREKLNEMLLQSRVNLVVGIRTSADYGDQNTVKAYKKLEEGSSTKKSDIPF